MSSSVVAKSDLLHLYKKLLRGCQKYPSKNRDKIFQSMREEFRENMSLHPSSEKAKQQIHVAYKGLSQLHQFDNRSAASFSVSLEQNPFPKPDGYVDKRTKAVDKVLEENSGKQ
mmetsp:Transcript_768/g.1750  ORF Transcript_768/g.1750 Transcript_768/m.1750 type:complete len:114 (+) Transcript_768:210-551(+)